MCDSFHILYFSLQTLQMGHILEKLVLVVSEQRCRQTCSSLQSDQSLYFSLSGPFKVLNSARLCSYSLSV